MPSSKKPNMPSLFIIMFGLCAGFIFLFLAGWGRYSFAEPVTGESNLHKAGETTWVVCLFALPYIGQAIGMISLFSKLRKDDSKASITFYIFSLATGFVLFSYSLLWALYSLYSGYSNDKSSGYLNVFSGLAVACVFFLLIPVVLLTYSITWKSSHEPLANPSLLHPVDFKMGCTRFHSELREQFKQRSPGRRIIEEMPDSIRKLDTLHDESDKMEFIKALNDVLKNPDFYAPGFFAKENIDDNLKKDLRRCKKDLTENEIQWVNRRLLEACYPDITENSINYVIPSRPARLWTNLLMDLKHGVAKAPFWALVFSFSVFLAVTYLFGFAFAFHDKKMIQEWNVPALYMAKSFPAAAGELSPSDEKVITDGIRASESIPWPDYRFYFNSNSASPNYRPNFDEEGYKELVNDAQGKGKRPRRNILEVLQQLEVKNRDWGESKNVDHLIKMADVLERSTNDDRAVVVELRGSSDDTQLKELTRYSSNYALSEARAQNVKFLLMSKLWDKSVTQRRIEWFCLPLSSEVLTKPPSLGREMSLKGQRDQLAESVKNAQMNEDDKQNLRLALDQLNGLTEQAILQPEEEKELLKKVDQLRGSLIEGKAAKERLIIAKKLLDNKQLPPEQHDFIISKLVETENEINEKLEQSKAELQETIDFVDHVEKNAGRRVVIATIRPTQSNNQPLLLKNDRHFIPLSLLDYMYFTIYTITTTGYGDIVPITTYAKFLCSLANILEVFFLVVFFNALLSVKGESKPDS